MSDDLTLPWENDKTPAPGPNPGPAPAPNQSPNGAGSQPGLASFLQKATGSPDKVAPKPEQTSTIRGPDVDPQVGQGSNGDYTPTGLVDDVIDSTKRGALKAVQNTVQTSARIVHAMNESDMDSYTDEQAAKIRAGDIIGQGVDKAQDAKIPGAEGEAKTAPGAITQSITQFAVGMAGLGKFRSAAGILENAGKVAKVALDSGLTGAAALDPYEGRVSNLVENTPGLSNPVTAFLKADPKDDQVTARFKSFIENAGLGAAGEGLFKIVQALRTARPLAAAGKGEAAANIMDTAAQDAVNTKAPQPANEPTPIAANSTESPANTPSGTGSEPAPVASVDETKRLIDTVLNTKPDAFGPQLPPDFNYAHFTQQSATKVIDGISQQLTPDFVRASESRATTEDLATALSADKVSVVNALAAHAANAEEIARTLVAGKQYLQFLTNNIGEVARMRNLKMTNGETGEAELSQLQAMVGHANQIQSQVKMIQKGAARATGAGNIDIKPITPLDPATADLLGMTKAPEEVMGVLRAADEGIGSKVLSSINEYRVNAMLSGFASTAVHTAGVLINSVVQPVEKYLLGGALSGNRDNIMAEGAGYAYGTWKSFLDSAKLAARAMYNEAPVLSSGGVAEHPPAISAINYSLDPMSVAGQIADGTGKFVRLNTRFRMGVDEFTKQMSYRSYMYGKAFSEASQQGLTGDDLSKYMEKRVGDSMASNGKGLDDGGMQWAKQITFTQDIDPASLTGKVQQAIQAHPSMKMLIPFLKVPYNLLTAGTLDHTPGLNMVRNQFRKDFMGDSGADAQALARGKMMTGMALITGAGYLAASGKITGSGPGNPETRKALMQTGWQPYSYKNSDGSYTSYARAEPFATHIGLMADTFDVLAHIDEKSSGDLASALAISTAHNLMNKTYFKGLANGIDAMSQPDTMFSKWINQFGASFVPSVAGSVANTMPNSDPYLRETRTFLESLRAKIPGLSDTLPPVRNVVGDPVVNKFGVGENGWNPATVSKTVDEPWAKEIGRLDMPLTDIPFKYGKVQLTTDQHDRWGQIVQDFKADGMTLKQKLNELVQSSDYRNKLTDSSSDYMGSRAKEIDSIVRLYRDGAFQKLLKEDKGLSQAVRQDKVNSAMAMVQPGQQAPQQQPADPGVGGIGGLLKQLTGGN